MKEITDKARKWADSIKLRIKSAEHQIVGLEDRIKGWEQEIANLLCPWEVGDKVIHNHRTKKGITHKKGVVTSLRPWYGEYQVWVRYINKDGNLSANESRVWDRKDLSLDTTEGRGS